MAYQNARGNAPATGMEKTPAPTKPKAPDVISQARLGGDVYGQNSGTSNPSVTNPGERVQSAMAKATAVDDAALDSIIKSGIKMDLGWQLRDVGDKNVPTHPGCKGASAGPTVPNKLGSSASAPVRKPD